ncbi:MAG: type I restriction endonuclease subunit S [Comamonadaceae bacterium]|nr:MAG: type I restriction endonuclease subunit S [Comamonadaceae bacterium]
MSELPQGWTSTTIKELAGTTGLFVDGDWVESKDQDPDGSIRLLQLADIGDGAFLDKSNRWINEDAFVRLRCTALTAGDVLVARMPDPLGRACLMPALEQRCVTVVDVAALRVDSENIDNRWVMQTINSPQVRAEIAAQSSGTTRRRISRGRLGEMEIPLPPKAEQTRIANQLDTLLARVQACNDRFDAIPALLKRFRQTVLDAATTGRLTEDWRGLDELKQDEWETVALQDVITEMRNGLAQKPTESPPGSKILRIGAVRSGQLNLDDHRYLVVTDKEAGQYALKQDDLLFTRYNGSLEFVGVCAALTHDAPGYVYPDKLIRVRIRADRAIAKFIEIVFGCRSMRTQVESFVKSSAGQRGVSGADLKAAKFSLPPITEQTEIVRRVEAMFALAARIEARCAAARAQAQRLTPLVLAKAFRGELVPQDPNDEPASALLERIASSNTAMAGKNKRKVPVAPKERAQAAINL